MDDLTNTIINEFVAFLTKELRGYKHFTDIEMGEWSLTGNKVTIEIFIKRERKKIYFDVREVKENRTRFDHLLGNAMNQLEAIIE